jgi:ribosomal protein L17
MKFFTYLNKTGKKIKQKLKVKNIRNFIRPVVTYGCEAWTLTNRDEQHLRIFERRILRKIFAQCKMKMDPGESE